MNIKLIILTLAAACGLAAQGLPPKQILQIPFAFDFGSAKMSAGSYELSRDSLSKGITTRKRQAGQAANIFAVSWDQKLNADNGVTFQVLGDKYLMVGSSDARTGLQYKLTRSRRLKEFAKGQPPEYVHIAAR